VIDYRYKAKLGRVIDGDTLEMDIDLGFSVWVAVRIRLARINAPELNSPSPEERAGATRAKEWLIQRFASNRECRLQSRRGDKYGRWLGEITHDNANLSDEMLSLGLAVAYVG
jgi:micrococcal nuclease